MFDPGGHDQAASIASAVERLRHGGVVAFPTETVYGLGADALNPHAVRRVFELKGRPSINPLIVHVTGPDMAARVAHADERAQHLMRRFWPGPLSLVLPKRDIVPASVTAGRSTVAVRSPDHPVTLALLFEFDSPLVGPSANRSGHISPTTAQHVREAWSESEVLVLEGGACRGGIESTVVIVDDRGVRVLRPGLIAPEALAAELGVPVVFGNSEGLKPGSGLMSPGLMQRHYAPRTPAVLVQPGDVQSRLDALVAPARAVVLSRNTDMASGRHTRIPMPDDPETYATRLYEALRQADAAGASLIIVEQPQEPGHIWDAIRDRLSRATSS